MEVNKFNILDLVAVTVGNMRCSGFSGHYIPSDVVLSGDNIMIGDNPVSIVDIMAIKHDAGGFQKLIENIMEGEK